MVASNPWRYASAQAIFASAGQTSCFRPLSKVVHCRKFDVASDMKTAERPAAGRIAKVEGATKSLAIIQRLVYPPLRSTRGGLTNAKRRQATFFAKHYR